MATIQKWFIAFWDLLINLLFLVTPCPSINQCNPALPSEQSLSRYRFLFMFIVFSAFLLLFSNNQDSASTGNIQSSFMYKKQKHQQRFSLLGLILLHTFLFFLKLSTSVSWIWMTMFWLFENLNFKFKFSINICNPRLLLLFPNARSFCN